jgi:hypothetical protein
MVFLLVGNGRPRDERAAPQRTPPVAKVLAHLWQRGSVLLAPGGLLGGHDVSRRRHEDAEIGLDANHERIAPPVGVVADRVRAPDDLEAAVPGLERGAEPSDEALVGAHAAQRAVVAEASQRL